jgi:hypothetical protein
MMQTRNELIADSRIPCSPASTLAQVADGNLPSLLSQ